MSRKILIEGTLNIDGVTSKYSISNYEAWFQWGASEDRLFESMDIVKTMQNKLNEEQPYFEEDNDE
tara:strand:+ start:77 stop:274 length:198 start_codon:yes stop_codon:yes gene_type:complete